MICALSKAFLGRSLAIMRMSKSLMAVPFPSTMLPKGTTSTSPRIFLAELVKAWVMSFQFFKIL